MVKDFDELQMLGKKNMDIALKSFGALSKGAQAIAVEVADYSKKSFEGNTAAVEKLFGAKTVEQAIELQTSYLKRAYDDFVAEATRLGELYVDTAKEAYKPYEGFMASATK
jgi:phasin family protein